MDDPTQVAEQAENLFYQGYNCCESTLAALGEALDAGAGCVPAVATGMGGGVAHTAHVCGALTGAIMAVGLAVPKLELADHAAEKDWANEVGAELVRAFEREFETVDCGRLIGVNFHDANWRDDYQARGCKERCSEFVRFAAERTAQRLTAEGL